VLDIYDIEAADFRTATVADVALASNNMRLSNMTVSVKFSTRSLYFLYERNLKFFF